MANDKARLSLITVSRNKEDEFNQYQTLAVALESDKEATIPSPSFSVENNVGRAAAKEFPDRVTGTQVKSIGLPFKFDYPQPHELAFCAAYGLGERIAPAALAAQGIYRQIYFSKTGVTRPDNGSYNSAVLDAGYAYPTSGDAELPSFTSGFRLSASTPVAKMLLAGCKLNTLTLEANRANRFPALSAEGISGGKMKNAIFSEILEAVFNEITVTLSRTPQGGDAAARLASLHALHVDVDGDGVFEHVAKATAVAANGDVDVQEYTWPDKVVYSNNGTMSDITDDNIAGVSGIPLGLVVGEDYLYIGFRSMVDSLYFDIDVANDQAATLVVEYWNGAAWSAVANLVDGTNGARPLAVPGNITFTKPSDWAKNYEGESGKKATLFWIRMSATSTNMKATAAANYVTLTNDILDFDRIYRYASGAYTDVTAQARSRNTGTVSLALGTSDYIYFGSSRPFGGFDFNVVATNGGSANAFTVEYWNGSAWTTVANVDMTDTAGVSFMIDGSVTFAWPAAWVKTTVNGESTERYWVRLKTSVAITSATAYSIKQIGRICEWKAVYHTDEATYLPEMASDASAYVEGNLMIAKAYVLLGGHFNGVELEGGVPYGCELASFTFTYNNNHKDPASCWQGGGDGEYADEILRGDPEATLQVNRRLIDWLVQNDIRAGQQFKVHIELQGPTISGTSPAVPYRARIHLDRVWYEEAGISVQDGRYQEQATLRVGESDEHPAVVVVIESKDSTGFAG